MADEDINKDQGTPPTSGDTPKDDQKPEKPTDTPKDSDFDYEKELERISGGQQQEQQPQNASKRSPADKATHSFKGIVKQLREHGVDPRTLLGDDDTTNDDQTAKGDKPLTADDVERIIEKRTAADRETLMDPIIDSKIAPITRSKGEAKLVKHWTKKFTVDGTPLDEAVEIGWFVANRHRFKETFAEIQRGKTAEKGKGDGTGSGQRKAGPKAEPTGRDSEFAKSRGLVWDDAESKYISPSRKTFLDKQRHATKSQ